MREKKAIILTEGTEQIGHGHITRCIALYDELQKQGFDAWFIINGDDSVLPLLNNRQHQILDWLHKKTERNKLINKSSCVIIDSYLADLDDYKEIGKQTTLLVSIDDYDRLPYPSGLIIRASHDHSKSIDRPAVSPFQHINKINPAVKELIGNNYFLLRREFMKVKPFVIRANISAFFITLGGSDIHDLTPKILKYLQDQYPDKQKIVTIGQGFRKSNKEHIKDITNKHTTKLIYNATAVEIKNAMLKADIAISAGGQTLNELARVGLPTIVIEIAQNQRLHMQSWERYGFILNAGSYQDAQTGKLFRSIGEKIDYLQSSTATRKKMSAKGRQLIDGRGAERIVQEINKILHNHDG